MKKVIASLCGAIFCLQTGNVAATETTVSVTDYHYDLALRQDCIAIRMNPATYSSGPQNACALTTTGSYGPDRITQTYFDQVGRPKAVYQAVGTSDIRQYAYYDYRPNGPKAYEIDANHNKTSFTYDAFDRLDEVHYPVTTAGAEASSATDYEKFVYDNNGNITSWRKRSGVYVYKNYDNLSRAVLTYVSDGSVQNISTGYDAFSRVIYKRFNGDAPSNPGVSYSYDSLGRITSTVDMQGRQTAYGYDLAGGRTVLNYPGNDGLGYSRDALDRVTLAWFNDATSYYVFSQSFDSLGRRIVLGRGATSAAGAATFAYDNLSRLTSMSQDFAGSTYDVAWSFPDRNPAGQIIRQGSNNALFDYKAYATQTSNRTYDGLNRDASVAAVTGYDANGNMTKDLDGQRTMVYDALNRLTSVVGAGINVKLGYDPEGRLAKYSIDGGMTYATFAYDGINLIAEYSSAGTLLRRFIHTENVDEPVAYIETGRGAANVRYTPANYQGSIIGRTDQNGGIEDYYTYDAYGTPYNNNNTLPSWYGTRFRYTGQVMLGEAKFYYYKARIYDPVGGRFLQTDPIGSDDDMNLYAYVGGDPVNKIDSGGTHGNAAEVLKQLARGAPTAAALDSPIAMGLGFGAMFGFGPGIEMQMNLQNGKKAYEEQLRQRAREADAAGLCMSPLDPAYKYSSQFKPVILPNSYPSKYILGPNDVNLQGKGVSFDEALNLAFQNTGLGRSMFAPTKWAKDKYGKSFPVQWNAMNGAEVNIDWAHTSVGPGEPHIGWSTGYRKNGGKSGHIIVDSVPYNRGPF